MKGDYDGLDLIVCVLITDSCSLRVHYGVQFCNRYFKITDRDWRGGGGDMVEGAVVCCCIPTTQNAKWKAQNLENRKIMQGVKLCNIEREKIKVQNYAKCKITQSAKLCKVQNQANCKTMQGVKLCKVQIYAR